MFSESATVVGIFLSSFGVGVASSAFPGPIIAYLIDRAVEAGLGAALLFFVGVLAVDAFVLTAGVVGFAGVLGEPAFTAVTAALGGVFLIWTGVGMMRRSKTVSLRAEPRGLRVGAKGGTSSIRHVVAGVSIAVASPLYWMWWATVGLGYINWTMGIGKSALFSFVVGMMSGIILLHVFVAFVFARGRKHISDTVYRSVVLVSGGILAGFGLYFVFLGFRDFSSW